jgi:hypothetical protein
MRRIPGSKKKEVPRDEDEPDRLPFHGILKVKISKFFRPNWVPAPIILA